MEMKNIEESGWNREGEKIQERRERSMTSHTAQTEQKQSLAWGNLPPP